MSTQKQKMAPVARPRTITIAFWLVILSAGFAIASSAISIASVMSPQGAAMLREGIYATPEALEGEIGIDALVSIAQSTAVVIQALLVLITLGVTLWIAIALRAGRGYIRILASILFFLQALGTIASPTVLSIGSLIVIGAAVALSWAAPSTRYISESTAHRRRGRVIETDAIAVQ
ncbi:hypothetical protein [Paeniglutamicibacter sp. NPDC091659]|uniref:hypothetical protein n=1 Tax=Paeniglutamicibacter sp. NPDC091659 TaxID=3364389 RepID=UPI00382C4AAD